NARPDAVRSHGGPKHRRIRFKPGMGLGLVKLSPGDAGRKLGMSLWSMIQMTPYGWARCERGGRLARAKHLGRAPPAAHLRKSCDLVKDFRKFPRLREEWRVVRVDRERLAAGRFFL